MKFTKTSKVISLDDGALGVYFPLTLCFASVTKGCFFFNEGF